MRQADVAEVEAVLEQETREGRPKLRTKWEQTVSDCYTKNTDISFLCAYIHIYIYSYIHM